MVEIPRSTAQPREQEPDFTASDPYQILGVTKTATQSEIKQAYFALIRQYPPETEADTFKLIRTAYEKIKSAKIRAETDIFLPQPPPAWQPPEIDFVVDTSFHPSDVLLLLRDWGPLEQQNIQDDFVDISL